MENYFALIDIIDNFESIYLNNKCVLTLLKKMNPSLENSFIVEIGHLLYENNEEIQKQIVNLKHNMIENSNNKFS